MTSQITIVGNVVGDPSMRFTPSGAGTCTFGVACNRRWMDRQTNEWKEATSFFDVVCWRDLADNVSESLTKGARVIVTGRLEQRSWETSDGDRRSKVEIVADEVGPSLRWATAEVRKADRSDGQAAAKPSTATSGGSGGGGYDEEPFLFNAAAYDVSEWT